MIGLVDGNEIDEVATALEVVAETKAGTANICSSCCAVAAAEVVAAAFRKTSRRGFVSMPFSPIER